MYCAHRAVKEVLARPRGGRWADAGALPAFARQLSSNNALCSEADSIWSQTLSTASKDLENGTTTAKALLTGDSSN